jgi:type IV pilus assembly protein PilO
MALKLEGANFGALPLGGKIFILFAGLAMLSAGYYMGVHMSLEEETEQARARNATLQDELRQAAERQRAYLKLREELAARDALDKQNLRILPQEAEIPGFLDDLNRLAELSGLQVGSVSPFPERAESFYFRVPVQLTVTGRYHQLAKFFYNISRLERAINMENITIGMHAGGESDEIRLVVGVLATTFRRKDEGA